MIDIVKGMESARLELLSYVKGILDADSYIWLRKLMSDINKQTLKTEDDDFASRVWPLFNNCLLFFKEYCTDVTAGSILVTFYIAALELGVREVGDSVEQLKQFTDEVDMEDWDLMNVEYAVRFDIRTSLIISCGFFDICDDMEIFAGGLHTMMTIDAVRRLQCRD